ncbi:hypothetical protein BESB_078280 [Besnoitia besnoiti]|uniref:Uncharacterized protein n=1 Tax=Besnoitia besnoiti TaxID=94643 RepID=A0A2A9ME00_BESBE|nr:hypothetical protein BESB_078280 [Besnoitia besnoiti]PFH33612.1 hypothetical protein BESB_078280 [Besnoitia besnoiti]
MRIPRIAARPGPRSLAGGQDAETVEPKTRAEGTPDGPRGPEAVEAAAEPAKVAKQSASSERRTLAGSVRHGVKDARAVVGFFRALTELALQPRSVHQQRQQLAANGAARGARACSVAQSLCVAPETHLGLSGGRGCDESAEKRGASRPPGDAGVSDGASARRSGDGRWRRRKSFALRRRRSDASCWPQVDAS